MIHLCPDRVHHEKLLLFLSDVTPYMVKAGKSFHRVVETVRPESKDVDLLISTVTF